MQKKNFTILVLAVVVLLLILYIFNSASLNRNISTTNHGIYIVKQSFPQYKIIKTFDTGIHLEAYVLEEKKNPDSRTITFTSEDGSVIVNGELLAWDRNEKKLISLNQIYANYFTSNQKAKELYLDLKKHASYIQQGNIDAPHKFYAIIDPSCSYCNRLFDATQPAIKSGQLSVRWVPLGALSNSTNIVNSLFNSKVPLNALIEYHNTKTYDKGLTQENEKTLNNMKLSNDIKGFPTILYKTPQDALKLSGGNKLPLTDATIANKDNIKKIDEFLLLTSNQF